MSHRPIYLDHNATTPLAPEALDAMLPYLREEFGNPSSGHAYGKRAKEAVEQGRAQVAALIGAKPDELVFTGCGTEANNLAIIGSIRGRMDGRRKVALSAFEHPAVQAPSQEFDVVAIPVDRSGIVEGWRERIDGSTALVSVMHANNEVGTIQPIRALADHAHSVGALMHTDAAQSPGKVRLDVDALGVDLLTLVAHKFYGPKGIGALYIRSGTRMRPFLVGAGHERGLRAGTENVASIVAMGVAAELAMRRLDEDSARLASLRTRFLAMLREKVPGLVVNGHETQHLCNTLHVSFPGVNGSAVLRAAPGVAASTGSACHGDDDRSVVLEAMGIPREIARGAVRLTLGRSTTEADLRSAAEQLAGAWASVR